MSIDIDAYKLALRRAHENSQSARRNADLPQNPHTDIAWNHIAFIWDCVRYALIKDIKQHYHNLYEKDLVGAE